MKNNMTRLVGFVLVLVISVNGYAAGEANLDVDSASISIIKKSLSGRFATLRPLFESGVIGLTSDGMVAVSNATKINQTDRIRIDILVKDENKDRATLYREIARANGRPDWENELQKTFGERWINRAPSGWTVKNAKGEWVQK